MGNLVPQSQGPHFNYLIGTVTSGHCVWTVHVIPITTDSSIDSPGLHLTGDAFVKTHGMIKLNLCISLVKFTFKYIALTKAT